MDLVNEITKAKQDFILADKIFEKQQNTLLPTSKEWDDAYEIWNKAWKKHQQACKAYFDNELLTIPRIH